MDSFLFKMSIFVKGHWMPGNWRIFKIMLTHQEAWGGIAGKGGRGEEERTGEGRGRRRWSSRRWRVERGELVLTFQRQKIVLKGKASHYLLNGKRVLSQFEFYSIVYWHTYISTPFKKCVHLCPVTLPVVRHQRGLVSLLPLSLFPPLSLGLSPSSNLLWSKKNKPNILHAVKILNDKINAKEFYQYWQAISRS